MLVTVALYVFFTGVLSPVIVMSHDFKVNYFCRAFEMKHNLTHKLESLEVESKLLVKRVEYWEKVNSK